MKTIALIIVNILVATCLIGQTAVVSFDHQQARQEVMNRLQARLTAEIEAQLKAGEKTILQKSYIREMLAPYESYGINPDDGTYHQAIFGIYTKFKEDPNYDPRAEMTDQIRLMIETRVMNYASSFIDKETQAIYTELKGLFDGANQKVSGLLAAAERMHDLPPDDPEIETKWANELKKLGINGQLPELIEDYERVFGQFQAKYGKGIEMLSMLKNGLSTDDPTEKIEILFAFGEQFGEDIPIVGSIVSNLFKLGREVLAAAKRAGGLLEANLGQGCISSDGEYVQGTKKKQAFYQQFPHIKRACPISQSATSGIYANIYFNTSGSNELLFYHKGKWLGSMQAAQDGTHQGAADIRAIRIWLKNKTENSKASDLVFLHDAYVKSPGFIQYRDKVKEKLEDIRQLSNQVYTSLSFCDETKVADFMLQTIGMNWLDKLMVAEGGFDMNTIKAFSAGAIEQMLDRMLINRYLSRHLANLERLDDIIDGLKNHMPVLISGRVMDKHSRQPLSGAEISCDLPLLFTDGNCIRSETTDEGGYRIFLSLPQAYSGNIRVTANYEGSAERLDLPVQIASDRFYELNFLLESTEQASDIKIVPSHADLQIGETVTFKVIASYASGLELDVTTQALQDPQFLADSEGTFSTVATYDHHSATATITVKKKESASECDDPDRQLNPETGDCDCIPPLLEDAEGQCVSADELEEETDIDCDLLARDLILRMEAAAQIQAAYDTYHQKFLMQRQAFFKAIHDQASDVCENDMISFTYYQAQQAFEQMQTLENDLVTILIDITYNIAVCPDLGDMLQESGLGADVSKWVEFHDDGAILADMTQRLAEYGCNSDDVAQRGESVAPGNSDPAFVGDGGASTEVAGDGKDNDGDGLQDEIPVSGLTGYNITIALYDSGDAKDDVFNLSVGGYGSLGVTPAGGLRTYGLNLPAGTYTAEVLVVEAPDDVGTFTISVLQHNQVIGTLTGRPGTGSVATVVFEVTE